MVSSKKLIYSLIALILLGSLVFYVSSLNSNQGKTTVTIAVNSVLVSGLPVYLAVDKGFWSAEGLDVQLLDAGTGPKQLDAVSSGKADFAGTVAEYPVMFASQKDPSFRFITTYVKDPYFVVARKSSGITSIVDLNGKKIGLKKQSAGGYYLNLLLNSYNLSVDQLDFEATLYVEALTNRNIDAFVWLLPLPVFAKKALGNDVIIFDGSSTYLEYLGLVGKKDYLDKNPDIVNKLLAGLMKTEEYMRANPNEVLAYGSKRLGLTAEELNYSLGFVHFNITTNGLVEAFNKEGNFAVKQKLISSFSNYSIDHLVWSK